MDEYFDQDGYDRDGYDRDGYDQGGYDQGGYDPDMQAELKAFERASSVNPFSELITSTVLDEKRKKPGSPTDKFYIKAYQTVNKINDDGVIKITQQDMRIMADKSLNVKELQYKNAVGYILGYIVSMGGQRIDKARLKKVIDEVLPVVGEDGGVEPPDVIRYARYWIEFL